MKLQPIGGLALVDRNEIVFIAFLYYSQIVGVLGG